MGQDRPPRTRCRRDIHAVVCTDISACIWTYVSTDVCRDVRTHISTNVRADVNSDAVGPRLVVATSGLVLGAKGLRDRMRGAVKGAHEGAVCSRARPSIGGRRPLGGTEQVLHAEAGAMPASA